MKKVKLFFSLTVATFLYTNADAQSWTSGTSDVSTAGDCKVGGAFNLSGDAFINGKIQLNSGNIEMATPPGVTEIYRSISANTSIQGLTLASGTNGSYMQLNAENFGADPGTININSSNMGTSGAAKINFFNHTTSGFTPLMSINHLGDVDVHRDVNVSRNGNYAGDVGVGGNFSLSGDAFINGKIQLNSGNIEMATPPGVTETYRHISGNTSIQGITLASGALGSYIALNAENYAADPGSINISSSSRGLPNGSSINFWNAIGPSTNLLIMSLRKDGTVLISDGSTPIPTTYHYGLVVQHGILTEKLKVANSGDLANWADFVFDNEYDLMPLTKVESFVKKNKHLPEIPSAKEVAKDGIDLASMDAKLLQKIEELTLYVIEQQKQIDKQQKQINILTKNNK